MVGEETYWFKELHTQDAGILLRGKVILKKKSKFQEILVIENPTYGRTLILDGCVMTTEKDEFFYHEMLVHLPILSHPNPKKVLIIGGGDGGALREVLKHDIEKAVLVELDEEVLRVAREFFPKLSSSFDDKRAEILSEEGTVFIKGTKELFDLIFIDSPDPVGFAKELFTQRFYRRAALVLNEGGILVAQTESPLLHLDLIREVNQNLKRIFPFVRVFLTVVPTYPGGLWSFTMASKSSLPHHPLRDPPSDLKVYSRETHIASLSLPPFLENVVA